MLLFGLKPAYIYVRSNTMRLGYLLTCKVCFYYDAAFTEGPQFCHCERRVCFCHHHLCCCSRMSFLQAATYQWCKVANRGPHLDMRFRCWRQGQPLHCAGHLTTWRIRSVQYRYRVLLMTARSPWGVIEDVALLDFRPPACTYNVPV
jgi:hypothetical protein